MKIPSPLLFFLIFVINYTKKDMAISFSTANLDFELEDKAKVKKWISEVVKAQGKKVGQIGYLFCDDAYLIEVNRTYLNHDTYTDIITFDYVVGDMLRSSTPRSNKSCTASLSMESFTSWVRRISRNLRLLK